MKKLLQILWTAVIITIVITGCKKDDQNNDTGNGGETPGNITDIDGNVYKTVKIGEQIWMAEDLKTTRYNDGTLITDDLMDDKSGLYDGQARASGLYTFSQANNVNFCPIGTHLPSVEEWQQLIGFIAHDNSGIHGDKEGTALKATNGWEYEGNGTDDYGFAALPGGYLKKDSTDNWSAGRFGSWWTSDTWWGELAWTFRMKFNDTRVTKSDLNVTTRVSVRCVKD